MGNHQATEPSDLLGPATAATGMPIKIGFVSDGQSSTIDNRSEIKAAQATAKYVNEHLGGIDRRPLSCRCATKQTPAGGSDSTNQMLSAGVPAVVSPVSGQGGTVFKGLQSAGIPLVMLGSIDTSVLTQPGAYVFSNPLGAALGSCGDRQEQQCQAGCGGRH